MRSSFFALLLLALVPACNTSPPATDDTGGVDSGTAGDSGARHDAAARSCFVDADCNDGFYCNGTEACTMGYCTRQAVVCDDGIACTADLCNETTQSCSSHAPDLDDDGFGDVSCVDGAGVPLGSDCDDTDPTVYPGNPETCDAIDQDCDPTTLGGGDTDHDGAVPIECCNPTSTGAMTCGRDCDDANPSISQLATEICDSIDNDCDAMIDESTELMSWPDVDLDGYGDASATPDVVCVVPSSRANQGGDCDDAQLAIHPMAVERCNGVDDDCDGTTDEGATLACAAAGTTSECIDGACVVTGCGALRFDCNGVATDGCEATLCDTSTQCGICGNSCGTSARLCDTGQCVLTAELLVDLNGLVHDQSTNMPIAGATVTTIDVCPEVSTTTRADGTFTLTVRDHYRPRWVRISAPGYPTHVQPYSSVFHLFPSSIVDAWRTDPDANATPGPTRAILVFEGSFEPGVIHDGHVGSANGAIAGDLSPFTGFGDRVVYLGAVPGRLHLAGRRDLGGGCWEMCTPEMDLWLEGGSVTFIESGFSCAAYC